MVGLARTQAASATARVQARLWVADAVPFRPVHGSFHAPMATLLTGWKEA